MAQTIAVVYFAHKYAICARLSGTACLCTMWNQLGQLEVETRIWNLKACSLTCLAVNAGCSEDLSCRLEYLYICGLSKWLLGFLAALTAMFRKRSFQERVRRGQGRSCIDFYDPISEVIWHHFHCTLFAKAVKKTPHLRREDIDHITQWQCQSYCKKSMWNERYCCNHLRKIQSAIIPIVLLSKKNPQKVSFEVYFFLELNLRW